MTPKARIYSPFQKRFRSQAVRLAIQRAYGAKPFFLLLTNIPGFTYLGLGPVAIYRSGLRFAVRMRA